MRNIRAGFFTPQLQQDSVKQYMLQAYALISSECWDMLKDIANHYFVDKARAAEMAISGYYNNTAF